MDVYRDELLEEVSANLVCCSGLAGGSVASDEQSDKMVVVFLIEQQFIQQ